MLSVNDIQDILITKVEALYPNIPIYKDVHPPVTQEKVGERIVIVMPGGIDNGGLSRSSPRICIYVPYIKSSAGGNAVYYRPNNPRFSSIESIVTGAFRSVIFGVAGIDSYYYKLDTITIEDDSATFSNFVNIKLNFNTINTLL